MEAHLRKYWEYLLSSKWYTLATIAIGLVIGGLFSSIDGGVEYTRGYSEAQRICREAEPKVVTKEVTKEVCTRESTWRELKSIDDKHIEQYKTAIDYCAEGIRVIIDGEEWKVDGIVDKINTLADEIEVTALDRLLVEEKLK